MFFFFAAASDPERSAIEELLGEVVLLQRQYHSYQTYAGHIAHYYALTDTSMVDLCIAEDSQYSRVFARYGRSILERGDYFPGENAINRIFEKG